MKIRLQDDFLFVLNNQVDYISRDKPAAARKFKSELLKNIKKDLKYPFHYKKSIYFDNENIRDYVFKGYICDYEINVLQNTIFVFGCIKHKASL
ncbi:ParE toxin of type II toxin-antitoxin system, parDE [Flavobacterium fryxellicola]|uniref:Plasmid stabilization protein n=1 Tax=Flavobacterium fryxellicola TaxID=249352 RepID=A0A167Y414_9FLAO|nr:type II toxin-antitoxin system RelE/ParE family toxin [Flavobacterium fryxellicola]OAB29006.1 plasmid stabilization protein [Flavobacterium fryxellicola]SHN59279.1 ParE toxin of type II toxin-antitoxin system, parDE [Flavobacterium fryxellicola]